MPNQNSINAPVPITVSNGGLGATSYTAYSVLVSGTTSTANVQNVSGLGATDQLLVSQGSGAIPAWTTAGWKKISTATASNSTDIQFTSGLSTTYNTYLVVFSQLIPANNNDQVYAQISTDGGSTYLNTSYLAGCNNMVYNGTTFTNTNSTTNFVLSNAISNVGGTTAGTSANVYFFRLGNSGKPTCCAYGVSTDGGCNHFAGSYDSTVTANAIKFYMSTGNITSGSITIYGLRK